jgi:hypothetical protein
LDSRHHESVIHRLAERFQVGKKFRNAATQRAVFADLGGFDKTWKEFRITRDVSRALLIEAHRLVAELGHLPSLLVADADQERQFIADGLDGRVDIGDVLRGHGC